jgi:hypothetical protein
VAEHGQRGGQHGQRGGGGDGDGGDPAVAHRAQEHLREEHQAGQRHRHGGRGEQHRPPGGGHRAAERVGDGDAGAQLLAEPADDEQAVVDGQAQAHDRDDVDREHRHVGDLGEQPEHDEGAEHGHPADQQRQPGGDGGPEHDQQQHEQQRHGQALGAGKVLAHLRVDLLVDRGVAAQVDVDPGAGVVQAGLDPLVRLHPVGQLRAGQPDGRVAGVPVGGHEGGGAHRPPGGEGGDVGGRQRRQRPLDRLREGRVVDRHPVAVVERDHVDVLPADRGQDPLVGADRLGSVGIEAAAGQRGHHAGAEDPGQHPADQGCRQHQPAPPGHGASPCLEHAYSLSREPKGVRVPWSGTGTADTVVNGVHSGVR